MRYQWKPGVRLPANAQAVGERLEQIRRRDGGRVDPSAMAEDATDPESPLHRCCEWDDDIAAKRHRESQMRHVLRCLVQVYEEQGETKTATVYYAVDPGEGRTYMAASDVNADEDLYQQALSEAVALLNGVRRRYAHLEELRTVFAAIDAAGAKKPRKKKTTA